MGWVGGWGGGGEGRGGVVRSLKCNTSLGHAYACADSASLQTL